MVTGSLSDGTGTSLPVEVGYSDSPISSAVSGSWWWQAEVHLRGAMFLE